MKTATWNESYLQRAGPTSPLYTPGMPLDRGATLPPGAYMAGMTGTMRDGTMRTGTLPSGTGTMRSGTLLLGMAAPAAHPKELKDNFKNVSMSILLISRSKNINIGILLNHSI